MGKSFHANNRSAQKFCHLMNGGIKLESNQLHSPMGGELNNTINEFDLERRSKKFWKFLEASLYFYSKVKLLMGLWIL